MNASFRKYALPVQTSVAVATAHPGPSQLREKYVQVSGTFSATLQLEGTIDGTAWFTLGATITAAALRSIPETIASIRVNTTVYASGTPVVTLAGWANT